METGEIFRRFLRNAGVILGSRVVFGLLNLATVAIAARAFGLAELGGVLLLQSYARVAGETVRFESWQTVLRYGATTEAQGDRAGFRRLVGFTYSVDLASFAVAVVGAVLLVPTAQRLFGWSDELAGFAPVFVLSMIFFTHATPNGVLRHFDRIGIVATQYAANAVIRFIGTLLAVALGGGALHLAWAWFLASVISGGIIIVAALRELWRRGLMPRLTLRWGAAGREFPGIWRYLWMTNLISSVPMVINYASTLVVGALLGPAPAAIFDIARQFARAFAHPAKLLGPLLFPDFARLAEGGDWRLMRQLLARQLRLTALGLVGLGLLLFGLLPWLVATLYGAEVAVEIWLFRLLLLGAMLRFLAFAVEPAFMTAGRPGTLLAVEMAATLLYLALVLGLLPGAGLVAMGVAMLAFQCVYVGATLTIGRRLLARRIARPAAHSGSTGTPPL